MHMGLRKVFSETESVSRQASILDNEMIKHFAEEAVVCKIFPTFCLLRHAYCTCTVGLLCKNTVMCNAQPLSFSFQCDQVVNGQ